VDAQRWCPKTDRSFVARLGESGSDLGKEIMRRVSVERRARARRLLQLDARQRQALTKPAKGERAFACKWGTVC